jgi:signal transduction histidine kinase
MMARLGVKARLTIFVTVVFALAASMGAVVLLGTVEARLVADTRATTMTILTDYLSSLYGGVPTLGVTDPSDTTALFYLDAAGGELSPQDYLERIIALHAPPAGSVAGAVGANRQDAAPGFSVRVDVETGEIIAPNGDVVTISVSPIPVGEPRSVDRGDEVMALAQPIGLPDGTRLQVGVSSPLKPVTESLDALRSVLWVAIPMLIVAVAAITWLAADRALRPVHSIASRTRAITATNLSQRVPTPEARDDVHELATTMNDMLDRLEQAQDRQRRFIADASHELRSPVAASRAQLEVALRRPETDWPATAATVLAEQESLGTLIDDLLALGRLDEQGIGSTGDVDLDELVLAEARRPRRITVRAEITEAVRIEGNVSFLTRALRNLADNAERHASGEVAVTLLRDGDQAIVHVDDDGLGLAPDQRVIVFDRFTRADESRHRDGGGAGLGLAIVRQVAEAHGGRVVCTDSPLGGARFTVTLPVRAPRTA